MVTLKCKMCGGDVIPSTDQTYGQCDSCGTFSTLPKIDTEQLANLYNRANHLRRQNDFDSALKIYENILSQDDTAAEAHWCAMLCRFGIEYVTDPNTKKKLPTCHRMSFDNILQDVDYLAALKYTPNASTKKLYTDEANYISQVQRYIFSIAQKEDPYDIFICYKETDQSGGRTTDSVEAQNLYDDLTNKGYKVFFARITLEDKLGTLFEPYIFSALHHSKVMLAIGTSKENFNAVWVRNEWSRYLKLCQKDRSRLLIPCYKNMDAYDVPEELSMFQGQDMSKIGFSQDLLRGIDKVLKKPEPQVVHQVVQNTQSNATIDSLLTRAFMFLEDRDVDSAKEYFNKILDINPRQAEAYIGLLCIELNLKKESDLKNADRHICNNINFQKAYKFADTKYKATLDEYKDIVRKPYYLKAHEIASANTIESFKEAIKILKSIIDYKDSSNCIEHYKMCITDIIYNDALKLAEKNTVTSLKEAIDIFNSIIDYKDSPNYIEHYKTCITDIIYNNAIKLAEKNTINSLKKAIDTFNSIIDYKDSSKRIEYYKNILTEAIYVDCINEANKGTISSLHNAIKTLNTIVNYKDSKNLIEKFQEQYQKLYDNGILYLDAQKDAATSSLDNYNKAVEKLQTIINYKDSKRLIEEYTVAITYLNVLNSKKIKIKDYKNAIKTLATIYSYKDSQSLILNYKAEIQKIKNQIPMIATIIIIVISIPIFNKIYEYAILYYFTLAILIIIAISMRIYNYVESITNYNKAEDFYANKDYRNSILYYNKANSYSDSKTKSKNITSLISNNISVGGAYTVGIKADGTVVAVGDISMKYYISNWYDIVSISASRDHTVALKADGLVVAVGSDKYRQCDVSNWSDIVSISAGDDHTVGLKPNGLVVAVGYNKYKQCDVSKWSNIVSISAGGRHTVGLKPNGLVVAVGYNKYKQCDVSNWSNIVAISAGRLHTVGLKANGLVVAVGANYDGRCDVSNWSDIVSISAGEDYTVGLKADGSVVAVGPNYSGQCNVSKWSDIVSIYAGGSHTVGLKASGSVVAVGKNDKKQRDVSKWSNIKGFN